MRLHGPRQCAQDRQHSGGEVPRHHPADVLHRDELNGHRDNGTSEATKCRGTNHSRRKHGQAEEPEDWEELAHGYGYYKRQQQYLCDTIVKNETHPGVLQQRDWIKTDVNLVITIRHEQQQQQQQQAARRRRMRAR